MKLTFSKLCFSMIMAVGVSLIVSERCLAEEEQKVEQKPSASSRSEIILNDCRIKLIDRVILGSDRPGVLEFVEPNEGDQVQMGKEIARLKTDALKASRATAEKRATNDIEIRYSKKARDTAYVELEMNLDINKRVPNTISKLDIKRLELNAEKSDLQIEQAELEFAMSKLQLEEIDAQLKETKIIAPFNGIVTKKFRSTGEVVRHGDEVVELVSTDRVRVEGYVNLEHLWKFDIGTDVEVQLDIPGIRLPVESNVYHGKISFIDVEVEPIHGKSVRVWAEVKNVKNELRAGYMATMKILPDEEKNKPDNKVAVEPSVKK